LRGAFGFEDALIYLPPPVPDDDAPPVPPLVLLPVPVPSPPPPSEPLVPTPLDVLPDVPPAPLTFPSSRRQRSFSRPVSVAQRELDAPAPVVAEPLVLLPMLPLGLDDVCAIAPTAKRAAAVALTNSFKLMKCSCN